MISVKKELNRLYILGTLITWFASYLTKSSQILKNHSIMLFTSNANSLQENARLDTLEARKHEEMQRSTRHGELKGELRQKVEVTRLQLAMTSSKSRAKAGRHSYSPPVRHGECRASTTRHGEHIYSGGELRRPNPSELTWQKSTGEESSTRHGEHIYSRGELRQKKI